MSLGRRVISLLLVPALLANQAAVCCAHAHHDPADNGHPTQAHMHLSHGSHTHHGHSHHGHSHHGHSHHGQGHDRHSHEHDAAPDSGTEPGNSDSGKSHFDSQIEPNAPANHDDDAVYVVDQTTIQSKIRAEIPVGPLSISFVPPFVCFPQTARPLQAFALRIHGPSFPYSCAIWLQTRALLI